MQRKESKCGNRGRSPDALLMSTVGARPEKLYHNVGRVYFNKNMHEKESGESEDDRGTSNRNM